MRKPKRTISVPVGGCLVAVLTLCCSGYAEGPSSEAPSDDSPKSELWRAAPGEGFRKGAHELEAVVGPGFGVRILEDHAHDWSMGIIDYGWVFTDVVGDGHWYRGSWELIGEIFGGGQYRPESAYFIGGGPHIRYDFASGHRWMPFLDLGAGATATDIRSGDISTTFEFNLQAGAGAHFFLRDNLALTVQARLIHFSNAGMQFPNLGVNSLTGLIGVSWFF
jgi:lipid A 3-O-deacylase